MTLSLFVTPVFRQEDDNGDPATGWKLYTYEPGTTTEKTAYTDQDGTEPATNPVVLDASGQATLWLDGAYKFVMKDASDVTKWTRDNIRGLVDANEISGQKTINFTSDADYTVSTANAKYAALVFTDTGTVLTTGRNVILPTDTRKWIVQNSTAQTLTFKTSSGTGKAVSAGKSAAVRGDGTNIVYTVDSIDGTTIGAVTPAPATVTTLTVNTGSTFPTGTFTPTIVGTTTAGVGTYTVQIGRYQRVGNRINYTITFFWTAHTGTGNMRISGLPFTAGASASMYVAVYQDSITFTGSFLAAVVPASGSQVQIRNMSSGASPTEIPLDTSGGIGITGSYEV